VAVAIRGFLRQVAQSQDQQVRSLSQAAAALASMDRTVEGILAEIAAVKAHQEQLQQGSERNGRRFAAQLQGMQIPGT
jgi:hypothetical protein